MTRRAFLKASALTPVLAPVLAPAVVAMGGVPAALAQGMPPLAQFADQLNTDLFSSDGLAVPIAAGPTASRFAAGLDRTLVLGGGGEYYVAWYCGFFHGLFEQGVDAPSLAEMIVGTSAGSYVGSSMASGHFQRLRTEFDFFGHSRACSRDSHP
jgi:NTE family protein